MPGGGCCLLPSCLTAVHLLLHHQSLQWLSQRGGRLRSSADDELVTSKSAGPAFEEFAEPLFQRCMRILSARLLSRQMAAKVGLGPSLSAVRRHHCIYEPKEAPADHTVQLHGLVHITALTLVCTLCCQLWKLASPLAQPVNFSAASQPASQPFLWLSTTCSTNCRCACTRGDAAL